MKGLQLLSKPRIFPFNTSNEAASVHSRNVTTEKNSSKYALITLPDDIFKSVIDHLDTESLLSLCLTNHAFYDKISKEFLYKDVKLRSKISLLKFNSLIHSKKAKLRLLVSSIQFKNPQSQDSLLKYAKFYQGNKTDDTTIAGSYNYTLSEGEDKSPRKFKTSDRLKEIENCYFQYTYIELMLDIIDNLPNLTHITLNDLEPNFKIPLWYSVMNDNSKNFIKKIINNEQSMNNDDLRNFEISTKFVKNYKSRIDCLPRFQKLELKSKKSVHLRSNLLCCFGLIDELILDGVIIDSLSLDTPMEFIPLVLERQDSKFYSVHTTFTSLILKNCQIISGNGILRLFNQFFKRLKRLSLLQVRSKYDILISNCFPSLRELTIDCNSKCFTHPVLIDETYYYDIAQENDIDLNEDVTSISETLLDRPVPEKQLQIPAPTSSVILSSNGNYISSTFSDAVRTKKSKDAIPLTKPQWQYFKEIRVPSFHVFYHNFKHVWDKLPKRNININIVNIPFTNVFPLSPAVYWERFLFTNDQETLVGCSQTLAAEQYPWTNDILNCLQDGIEELNKHKTQIGDSNLYIMDNLNFEIDRFNNFHNYKNFKDIPYINLFFFFSLLSKFSSIKIKMLRRWINSTKRTRYDWELLLRALLLNVNVPVEVRDQDGFILYSYGDMRQRTI
ncbi:hypothetical protein KAFR_0A08470 [Kazachstania africana CBS 2517]|uniref:F-box domain-containing protein n=1 Tax=Kazachstania africana (strain ATCC 22294 / BCRC 22015 / CBS 2517 / CECT 1963 / NBRC 1671 / NRRL Y-8276) TaxID=1071382 RepID=H2API1_KAZAF|nr:hypothetical protein KAFR_0A08470 [Kazachstania africana CBS 2517]CCF56281.1 hypothetical protein KAFR_0A08470 [Kazachstania africana CBS 2517]